MDLDEMSILYRGLFIDAFYQVSVHLAKRFQRRRIYQFTNQSLEHSPFSRKKLLSLWSIVKTTEWNGLIKIDN
jgi:hypothetical protein